MKLLIWIIILAVAYGAATGFNFGSLPQSVFNSGEIITMLATIMDFVFIWIFPIVAIGCVPFAFYFNNSKDYGNSTFLMFVSVGLAITYFWSDLNPMFTAHGKTSTILFLVAAYIIAGVCTSFIYWIFYNWKAKERFEEFMNEKRIPTWAKSLTAEEQSSVLKYLILKDDSSRKHIFDDRSSVLNIEPPTVEAIRFNENLSRGDTPQSIIISNVDASVASVLPPRFKACKQFIIGAGCSWPVTIIWLMMSRVVKQLIERLVSMFGGTFDKISKIAFGKF
jgi:hypothetical protein